MMEHKLVKELDRFLEISDEISIPFKWFEIGNETIVAEIEMVERSLWWQGMKSKETIDELTKHEFVQVESRKP